MLNRKMLVVAALLLGAGGVAHSITPLSGKVAPLSASDRQLKKCERHGTQLKLGVAPITYGIVTGWPSGYYQAGQRAFPHAQSRLTGGCVVSKDSPRFQSVKFCPQCRTAEKKWLDAQKPKR